MFKENKIFYPKENYVSLDFKSIKQHLKTKFSNYYDYDDLFIIKEDNYAISVNTLGTIRFNYLNITKEEIFNNIDIIEKTFKSQVEEFQIIH